MIRTASLFDILQQSIILAHVNSNISSDVAVKVLKDIARIIDDLKYIDRTQFIFDRKYEWKGE